MILKKPRLLLAGASLIAFVLMGVYIAYLSSRLDTVKLQRDQNKVQLVQCVKQYQLGQDIINEYQNNIDDLSRRYNAIIVRHDNTCARITRPTADDNEGTEGRPVQENGVPARTLLDFGKECERIRLQLNAAQRWIKEDGR